MMVLFGKWSIVMNCIFYVAYDDESVPLLFIVDCSRPLLIGGIGSLQRIGYNG